MHQAAALAREFGPVNDRIQKMPGTGADVVDLKRQSRELISRIGGLYGAVGRWTGAPTKDQLSRLAYYQTMVKQLTAKAAIIHRPLNDPHIGTESRCCRLIW